MTRTGGWLLVAGALALPLWLPSPYHLHVAIMAGIFGVLAMSLNLLLGYTGQLSLGHAAFFGIGALVARSLCESERDHHYHDGKHLDGHQADRPPDSRHEAPHSVPSAGANLAACARRETWFGCDRSCAAIGDSCAAPGVRCR